MGVLVERYREELRRAVNPVLDRSTLAQTRITFAQMMASSYPFCGVTGGLDRDIGSSAEPLPIRVYGSNAIAGPVILFFHGGGFVLGSLDSYDGFCRHVARSTGMPVVSVGYSLAPERPSPAAVEDGYAAARWLIANQVPLNVEPGQIIVMGDSAGGYIATRVAVAFPDIALQVLLYPALDFTMSTVSHLTFGRGYGLDREVIAFCYECFLGRPIRNLEVLPALGAESWRAPPAIVIVAEADPLRDEGVAYAQLMNSKGRGAALWDIPDTAHGFAAMPALFPQAWAFLERLAKTLRSAFSSGGADYTQIIANAQEQDPARV